TDRSISCILNLCLNLRKLDIAFSCEDIKDASTLIYYQTISELEISYNNISNEVIEALAYTCHKLEHFKLD
ncbi:19872_t:CDS:2, partial [Funneliformis geosporum]